MAAAITVFNAPLTGSFVAGTPFVIQANKVVLDFTVVVTLLATVEWFLEFSDDNTLWSRELSEETAAGGVVTMAKVVRTFKENGGAALAVGTHQLDAPFTRTEKLCRIQARASAGTASMLATSSNGIALSLPT